MNLGLPELKKGEPDYTGLKKIHDAWVEARAARIEPKLENRNKIFDEDIEFIFMKGPGFGFFSEARRLAEEMGSSPVQVVIEKVTDVTGQALNSASKVLEGKVTEGVGEWIDLYKQHAAVGLDAPGNVLDKILFGDPAELMQDFQSKSPIEAVGDLAGIPDEYRVIALTCLGGILLAGGHSRQIILAAHWARFSIESGLQKIRSRLERPKPPVNTKI